MFQLIPPVYAQCNPGSQGGVALDDCLLLNQTDTVSSKYDSFATIVNVVVSNAFVVGGIILFLMIFYAGFKFISGGSKAKDEARTMITTAAIGMVVMFVAYWIIKIIEVIIGAPIFI